MRSSSRVCAGAAAERLTKVNVCENHVATRGGRGRAEGLQGGRRCSRGSEPGPGAAGPGSVIALFFLTDCAGIPGLWGGLVVVKCCLDIHVQYSLIYLSFVCVDLHHCFY